MDIIEKNNRLAGIAKEAKADVSYAEIAQRTGGLLFPLVSEDAIYVERIANGIPTARITDVEILSMYIEAYSIQQTRRKLIEITDVTESITIDLSPYKLYSKFRIQFPAIRTFANISISIEGIADLKYGIESIIMSGLGSDTDYLSSDKRGTITFTLDSTDYEFPSSIYHFGSFATGGTPATIFLHIDYTEADSSSAYKYVTENAIYADTGKIACELWSINTVPDADGSEFITPFKENTTLLFKSDGIVDNNIFDAMNYFDLAISLYDPEKLVISTYLWLHATNLSRNMPIIRPTGFLSINEQISMCTYDKDLSGYEGAIEYRNIVPSFIYGTVGTIFDMYRVKGQCIVESTTTPEGVVVPFWTTLPTDFGLYRVIVKGKFAQNQLNN